MQLNASWGLTGAGMGTRTRWQAGPRAVNLHRHCVHAYRHAVMAALQCMRNLARTPWVAAIIPQRLTFSDQNPARGVRAAVGGHTSARWGTTANGDAGRLGSNWCGAIAACKCI